MTQPKHTTAWLQAEYARLNRRYFGGLLPANTELRWVRNFPEPHNGAYGRTGSYRAAGTKPRARITGFYIAISRRAERVGLATVTVTLLHEMAHIATWRKSRCAPHGRAWVMEMRRLAATGAFDRIW